MIETQRDARHELLRGIEARLEELLPSGSSALDQAMEHALLAPGKRLRPVMVALTTEDLGGGVAAALDLGCAVEMVHTASLILDDLPCMDDAALRRGRQTTHRAHGEDVAVLAAVSLLARAFEVTAAASGLAPRTRGECVASLARAVGAAGLCAGQLRDLEARGGARDRAAVEETNALKTGALFVAAIEMGVLAAGRADALGPLRAFAGEIGHAFQLLDDLRDDEPAALTGKEPGRDVGKPTLISLIGEAPAELRIERHLADGHMHLDAALGPGSRLAGLVQATFPAKAQSGEAARAG